MNTPTFRDVEQLSALLDGKLSPAEAAKLETRIRTDRNLRILMEDLSETRGILRRMPRRRAPRNFTLTAQMAGVKPPIPRLVPVLRFATVLATFLLVFSMATNVAVPAFKQAAQAPVYGMGGGGGGGAEGPSVMSSAATEAPATQAPAMEQTAPQAGPLPTQGVTPAADNGERIPLTATPEAFAKNPPPSLMAPNSQPGVPGEQSQLPVSQSWILALLGTALVCGAAAWLLRWASERKWRAKTK